MTTILNSPLVHNAPRPFEVAGGQAKTGTAPAEAAHSQEAGALYGNGFVSDDATVRPKLYDALQSILADARAAQADNSAHLSLIRDSGAADEIIHLAKTQILSQSGSSALGQANKDAQAVLGLLK